MIRPSRANLIPEMLAAVSDELAKRYVRENRTDFAVWERYVRLVVVAAERPVREVVTAKV